MSDRFAGRSVHGVPQHAKRTHDRQFVTVSGLVARSLELSFSDLAALEHTSLIDHFAPDQLQHWPSIDLSGVRLDLILKLAQPLPRANWIRISSGPLATVLPIADAAQALLCDRLDGALIPVERGGPLRLAYPAIGYNLSVKWVDGIWLSDDEPDRSAERVAIARQRAREANA
jgi:DMSO/TMAO reductase YedYZ molybdopterin-dependent catalytic subunit